MNIALLPGTIFAGYRVESLIARGGMGVVYLASDLSLHRSVALKLIAPELAEDERFRQRFLRESRLVASLDHPSVVPIYEAGEHDGTLYLAMRFVDGTDLSTLLRRSGTLAPQRSLPLLARQSERLAALLELGVARRRGECTPALVVDRGLAKSRQRSSAAIAERWPAARRRQAPLARAAGLLRVVAGSQEAGRRR
jgi:hypothetical protein